MSKSPEELDHTPLTFGKYKGMTPSEVAEIEPTYLRWMYEEVKNKPTCSELLYRDCAGKKSPQVKVWRKPEDRAPKTGAHIKNHFDDMDDDIPF